VELGSMALDGSFEIGLFRKGAGEVNLTQSSIQGNVTLTFLNMTPGTYMAEITVTADNGNRSVATSKFGVKSQIAYNLTTRDSTNTRNYFKASEAVYVDIAPSVPQDTSVIMITPDGSKASLPASPTVTITASQKSSAGWYMLRLESSTGIAYATAMFQVKS